MLTIVRCSRAIVARLSVARILDPEASDDRLEFLASRVAPAQVGLHVPEQRGHLTEYVLGVGEAQQVRLGRVEVAPRPLDQRPVAEDPERLRRIQLPGLGRLPGRLEVVLDRRREDRVVPPPAPCPHPVGQRFELLGSREGALAPGDWHGPTDRVRPGGNGDGGGSRSSTPARQP
jgi:hypothetical protein